MLSTKEMNKRSENVKINNVHIGIVTNDILKKTWGKKLRKQRQVNN